MLVLDVVAREVINLTWDVVASCQGNPITQRSQLRPRALLQLVQHPSGFIAQILFILR